MILHVWDQTSANYQLNATSYYYGYPESNRTPKKSWIQSLIPLLISIVSSTCNDRSSLDWFWNRHAGDDSNAGNSIAVAVATGVWPPATGNGRPSHRQTSWELHASIRSSNMLAETIEWTVGLLNQLSRDRFKKESFTGDLIIMMLSYHQICTGWVDHLVNHTAHIVSLFGMCLCQGSTKIWVEMTKYISVCIINHLINVPCITLTLCSTSGIKHWQNSNWNVFHMSTQLMLAGVVKAMNGWSTLYNNDQSFNPVWCMQLKYVCRMPSASSVPAYRNLQC